MEAMVAAQGWLDRARADDTSNNRQIFDTGWTYGSTTSSGIYGFCIVAGACRTRTRVIRIGAADQGSASNEWENWVQSNTQCGSPLYQRQCNYSLTKAEAENGANGQGMKLTDWLPSVALKDPSH
jgi:hypothetical protein